MKTLILYYSRTGVTKKLATYLQTKLNCDAEEIIDTKARNGALGYILAGKDATLKKTTVLQPIKSKIEDYDLVIIGTPVWFYTMSTPARTLVTENKEKIKNIAFFCTMGSSGDDTTFKNLEELIGLKAKAQLTATTIEVMKDSFQAKANKFIEELSQ